MRLRRSRDEGLEKEKLRNVGQALARIKMAEGWIEARGSSGSSGRNVVEQPPEMGQCRRSCPSEKWRQVRRSELSDGFSK